jgi:hypothetical protein
MEQMEALWFLAWCPFVCRLERKRAREHEADNPPIVLNCFRATETNIFTSFTGAIEASLW